MIVVKNAINFILLSNALYRKTMLINEYWKDTDYISLLAMLLRKGVIFNGNLYE